MATIISESKVYHQMFKCFNCGRRTVSLNNSISDNYLKLLNIEDDDLDEREVLETLETLDEGQDDWQASCSRCGWSDS